MIKRPKAAIRNNIFEPAVIGRLGHSITYSIRSICLAYRGILPKTKSLYVGNRCI